MFCYGSDSPASRMRITEELFAKVQTAKVSYTQNKPFDEKLLHLILLFKMDDPNIPMIIVLTKCDLGDQQRKYFMDDAHNLAKELRENIKAIETSAKSNINVREAFKLMIRQIKAEEKKQAEKIKQNKKKKGCILS